MPQNKRPRGRTRAMETKKKDSGQIRYPYKSPKLRAKHAFFYMALLKEDTLERLKFFLDFAGISMYDMGSIVLPSNTNGVSL